MKRHHENCAKHRGANVAEQPPPQRKFLALAAVSEDIAAKIYLPNLGGIVLGCFIGKALTRTTRLSA